MYLANSLMLQGHPVYWISASDYNPRLAQLEISLPERMVIVFDNDMHRVIQVLKNLPEGSDVFLDSIVSMYSDLDSIMEQPYLTFGKACSQVVQQRKLHLHLIAPLSGMSGKPLTDIFDRSIQYRVYLKKIKSYKDFVGLNYQVVGNYYHATCDGIQQVIPAGLFDGIDPQAILFFWLVATGKIQRVKRSYFYNGENLGSEFKKILKRTDGLLLKIYSKN